ncbi:MAG: hypothetical protein ACRDGM_00695, partial [bacterium]
KVRRAIRELARPDQDVIEDLGGELQIRHCSSPPRSPGRNIDAGRRAWTCLSRITEPNVEQVVLSTTEKDLNHH